MNAPLPGPVAVLTGDVVGSSRLDPPRRARLLDTLKGLTPTLRRVLGDDDVPLPLDVYGGDGWQVLIVRPSRALRAALLIRTTLMAEVEPDANDPVDTRVVVARGPIDTLSPGRVSESEGPAFRLSGRTLTKLSDRRLAYVDTGRSHLADWDVVARLLDTLARDWTARQARTVLGALQGLRQDAIGALWTPPVSQPNVAKHLRAARWDDVDAAVRAWEERFGALEVTE